MSSMFDVYEEKPEVLTLEQMRAELRRMADHRPEDVYGCGSPKGHVAAVLAGREKPLPELLAVLELREERGSYMSTRAMEPDEPFAYTWPDGRPFTPEDEAEVRLCVHAVCGMDVERNHEHLSEAVFLALGEYDKPGCEDADARGFSLAFLAGVAWAKRRAGETAAG